MLDKELLVDREPLAAAGKRLVELLGPRSAEQL